MGKPSAQTALRLRILDPRAGSALLLRLWQGVFGPEWPMREDWLRSVAGGSEAKNFHLAAEWQGVPVGFALAQANGTSGAVLALGVLPAYRRRGVGRALHQAALQALDAHGMQQITLGSGGASYFWPGVPVNIAGAWRFFERLGWVERERSLDMITELDHHRTATWVWERVGGLGLEFSHPEPGDAPRVEAFVRSEHPAWSAFYALALRDGRFADVLLARRADGAILGACLLESPSPRWEACFAAPAGAPGCLLTAGHARGQGIGMALIARATELLRERGCRTSFLGWTWLVDWYGKLGYRVWQEYIMSEPRAALLSASSTNTRAAPPPD